MGEKRESELTLRDIVKGKDAQAELDLLTGNNSVIPTIDTYIYKTITIKEFERKVLEKEGIVIVVRGPSKQLVYDYNYQRRMSDNSDILTFIKRRLKPSAGVFFEIVIFDGDQNIPHGSRRLGSIRKSYQK